MKKLLFAAVIIILAAIPARAKAAVTAADFSVSNTSGYSGLIGGKSARINVSGGSSGATHKVVWHKDNWAEWGVLVAATTSKSINVTLPNKNGLISLVLDTTVGSETKSVTKTYNVQHNGKSLLPNPRTNEVVPDWVWGSDSGFRNAMVRHFGKNLNQVTWSNLYYATSLGTGDYDEAWKANWNNMGDVIYYMPNLSTVAVSGGKWKLPINFAIFPKLKDLWASHNGNITIENIPVNSLPTSMVNIGALGASIGGISVDLRRYPNLESFDLSWRPVTQKLTSVNITGLKKLNTLYLSYSVGHQNNIIGFNTCTSLRNLWLAGITMTDLSFFSWHNNFEDVQLQNCGLTHLPAAVGNQTKMWKLAVHTNKMNNIPSLARCSSLTNLEVGTNQMTTIPTRPSVTRVFYGGGNLYPSADTEDLKVKIKAAALNLKRGVEYKTESTIINDFACYLRTTGAFKEALRTGHTYKLVPYTGYTQYFEDTNGDGSYTIKRNIYVPRTVQARLMVDNAVYSDVFNINVVNEQINMVVPTTITAAINPNRNVLDYNGNSTTDSTDTFSSPAFAFQNKAVQPMKISITGISPVSSPSIVAANTYSDSGWANLSSQLSGSRIALGFRMKNKASWLSATTADAWYSPGQQYTFGVLPGSASAAVELKAKYGLSHSARKTLTYNVTYKIEHY